MIEKKPETRGQLQLQTKSACACSGLEPSCMTSVSTGLRHLLFLHPIPPTEFAVSVSRPRSPFCVCLESFLGGSSATSLRVLLLESRSYENEARRLAHCASWGAESGGCPLKWPAPAEAHQGVPRVSGLSPCTSPLIPTLLLQWSFLSLLSCLVLVSLYGYCHGLPRCPPRSVGTLTWTGNAASKRHDATRA